MAKFNGRNVPLANVVVRIVAPVIYQSAEGQMPYRPGPRRQTLNEVMPGALRHERTIGLDEGVRKRPMVVPFARALSLLAEFGPQDVWLSNREMALRTGLPPSTVSRLAHCLSALGYLHHNAERRRYRLSASVLALGYAATSHSDMQLLARPRLQGFAEQHKVHVSLCTRDRLEMIVLERHGGVQANTSFSLHVGTRLGLASSPMGWAMLAALPDMERYFLLGNVQRRMPHEWPRLRRRSGEAISQVHAMGFCTSLGEWDSDLGIVAVPLLIPGSAPLVLSCLGPSVQMTRARVEREIGPKLVGMATAFQEEIIK